MIKDENVPTVEVSRKDWDAIHTERDKWKDEYFNLVKSANQYEAERDRYKEAWEKIVYGKFHIGNDDKGNVFGPPDGVMCRKIAQQALMDKNKCKHSDFWFDRSIELCGPNCEGEQMHNRCVDCGLTTCQIKALKGKEEER